jgi:hypothetical protein
MRVAKYDIQKADKVLKLASIFKEIETEFPNERITRDLNEQLFKDLRVGESVSVDLDGLGRLEISSTCQHEVCSAVLQRDLVPAACQVRIFCAVGGIKSESQGIIEPNICFAVLEYDTEGSLITYDLHSSQFY